MKNIFDLTERENKFSSPFTYIQQTKKRVLVHFEPKELNISLPKNENCVVSCLTSIFICLQNKALFRDQQLRVNLWLTSMANFCLNISIED